jgi:hypothetical protein
MSQISQSVGLIYTNPKDPNDPNNGCTAAPATLWAYGDARDNGTTNALSLLFAERDGNALALACSLSLAQSFSGLCRFLRRLAGFARTQTDDMGLHAGRKR